MRFAILAVVLLLASCEPVRSPEPPSTQSARSSAVYSSPEPERAAEVMPLPTALLDAKRPVPSDCTRTTPGPFDRGCAWAAVMSAVRRAHRCGFHYHVKAVFAPDGSVIDLIPDGAPADEATAACLRRAFDEAHVPPFVEGQPVPVGTMMP